jgi:transcriptional regulator with XRE-family HTH domain
MAASDRTEALNREVRAQIVRTGRTRRAVAEGLDVSLTQLYARLRGEVIWSADELWAVADLLGVPLATLISSAEQHAVSVPA